MAPAAAAVPAGFTDTVAIGGLSSPTAAAFAPDGRVFVAEKSGLVKVFDNLADPTATVFADLRTPTQDFWDRGLLGLAVDPAFPARPYVYVSYTLDALPGGSVPQWGDTCPTPPGATDQGCVVTGRVSQLTMGPAGTAVSESNTLTTPRFSATNTRPSGAKRTAVGLVSPLNVIDSWKPAGRVAAFAAGAVPASMAASDPSTRARESASGRLRPRSVARLRPAGRRVRR